MKKSTVLYLISVFLVLPSALSFIARLFIVFANEYPGLIGEYLIRLIPDYLGYGLFALGYFTWFLGAKEADKEEKKNIRFHKDYGMYK